MSWNDRTRLLHAYPVKCLHQNWARTGVFKPLTPPPNPLIPGPIESRAPTCCATQRCICRSEPPKMRSRKPCRARGRPISPRSNLRTWLPGSSSTRSWIQYAKTVAPSRIRPAAAQSSRTFARGTGLGPDAAAPGGSLGETVSPARKPLPPARAKRPLHDARAPRTRPQKYVRTGNNRPIAG